jgi:hypothetical protein
MGASCPVEGYHVKLVVYEWGAILFAIFAATCGVYWGTSLITNKASFALKLGNQIFYFGNGELSWAPSLSHFDAIQMYDRHGPNMTPQPTRDARFSVLGIRYRRLAWPNRDDNWMACMSLAIPTLAAGLLGAFFYWRLRVAARRSPSRLE